MYDVYSPFDMDQHRKTFVHYLEVIVLPDGTIKYAIPSHQMSVELHLAEAEHISIQELRARCPKSMYGDYSQWLCEQSGCIMLWEYFCIGPNQWTAQQVEAVNKLIKAGLYVPGKGETNEALKNYSGVR